MQTLISFIVNSLIQKICDGVDTAFGNNLGIDSICVLSSFTFLTWLFIRLTLSGVYAFKVTLKDEKLCLLLNVAHSILVGIVIFCTRSIVPHIFQLTDSQYDLFEKCLAVYSVGIVAKSVYCFLYYYLMYSCRMKLVYVSNACYYPLLFITDFIVVKKGYDLSALIATTALCNFICSAVLLFASGILQSHSDFSLANVKRMIRIGNDVVFNEITSKIANIVFNSLVSRLGTDLYAIYSVSLAAELILEAYSDSLHEFAIVKLKKVNGVVSKYKVHLWILKKYTVFLLVLTSITAVPVLFLLHGTVSMTACVSCLLGYFPFLVTKIIFNVSVACLCSVQRTDILRFNGIIGIIVKLPVAYILFKMGAGIFGFAAAMTLDFVCRTVYNEIHLKRIIKQNC